MSKRTEKDPEFGEWELDVELAKRNDYDPRFVSWLAWTVLESLIARLKDDATSRELADYVYLLTAAEWAYRTKDFNYIDNLFVKELIPEATRLVIGSGGEMISRGLIFTKK
jgi:hypothetical protein